MKNKPKMIKCSRGVKSSFFRKVKDFDQKKALFAKAFDRKTFVLGYLQYIFKRNNSWRTCYEMRFFEYKVRNYY